MSDKSKNILLGVLIVGLVSMTVAYAALSTTLSIRGTATVDATNWDIHFANVTNATTSENTLGGTNAGKITSMGTLDDVALATSGTNASTGTLISGLTVSLHKPGDWVKVNFDIVNTGTIDAKLGSFSKTIAKNSESAATGDVNDGITYTVKCAGETPAANAASQALVKTTGSVSCELYVYYNELTNSHTAGTTQTAGDNTTRTFTLTADWQYVQN